MIDYSQFTSGSAEKDFFYPINGLKKYSDTSIQITNGNSIIEGDWKKGVEKSKNQISVSVFDVAAYIVKSVGAISTMKLQKLLYYTQAWSLVWDEAPLFREKIEAWANGPVIRELFNYHKGLFTIVEIPIGNPDILSPIQKDTVNQVLAFYGEKDAKWLIDLTHLEAPWINSRKGLSALERGSREIPLDTMAEYYSSL